MYVRIYVYITNVACTAGTIFVWDEHCFHAVHIIFKKTIYPLRFNIIHVAELYVTTSYKKAMYKYMSQMLLPVRYGYYTTLILWMLLT